MTSPPKRPAPNTWSAWWCVRTTYASAWGPTCSSRKARICRVSEGYPAELTNIVDPPVTLYVRGDADFARRRRFAVVGSRRATRDGLRAAAEISQALAENGVTSALISLGGNIMTLGARPDGTPWRIAIRDPLDESAYAGIVRVANMAVVTSGGYERYFELDARSYHHILDPATGMPAQSGLISATIVCESGMLADGLSTALFVMGEEKALSFWRAHADLFDFVLVADEGRILVSAGIADAFSSERGFEVVR